MDTTLIGPVQIVEQRDNVLGHAARSMIREKVRRESEGQIKLQTYEYGPFGVPLKPTPRLSKTSTEYSG